MRIGQFAKALGLTPPTVRYYESLGLVAPAGRVSGSRRYDDESLVVVRLVLALKRAGFTLTEVQGFLALGEAERTRDRWRRTVREKLAELDRGIAELRAARSLLAKSVDCDCDGHAERCVLLTTPPRRESRGRKRRFPARRRPVERRA